MKQKHTEKIKINRASVCSVATSRGYMCVCVCVCLFGVSEGEEREGQKYLKEQSDKTYKP